MIHPWLQAAFYLPSIVGMVFLIVFVLVNNPRNYLSRVFSALSGAGLFYITTAFIANLSSHMATASFLMRLADAWASTLAGFMFWLVWIFPERRPIRWTNWLLLPPSLFFFFAPWMRGYLTSLTLGPYGYVEHPGPIGWAYQLWVFGLVTGAVLYLFYRSKTVAAEYRPQVRFMAYGIGIVLLFNLIFNFSGLPLHLDRYSVFFAVPSYLALVATVGYAMFHHDLFDIRPLVARSLAYSLLLITLSALYATAVFGVSQTFFIGRQLSGSQQAVYTLLAVMLAFTFQPLRRFFERLTDRIFFRDSYDTEQVLNQLGEIILSEIILTKLLKKTLALLCRRLRIASGHFVILHSGRIYNLANYGQDLKSSLTMEELRLLGQPVIVADTLDDTYQRQLLTQLGVRVSVLLRTKDQFVGYLMLGNKLSGEVYADKDVELLKILAAQLAVAISNAMAYEQVSKFNETLKDRVNRATARLRVANTHLKDLDQAKDEFISMASHQLRTPLTTIKGYVSMMLEEEHQPLPPVQRQYATMAFESTQRMVAVISDLLNVSRLSAGRFVLDPEPTDLAELVRDEVQLLQRHAELKGLKLILLAPKSLPKQDLDASKLRQVIINFIDNAIYYTKTGSVTVTLANDSGHLRFSVTDTGIGVPEAAKAKLFTKFYRADNARNVRPDGTGLGLFLAKKVVEACGGKILFTSHEGEGSLFGFELPPPASAPVAAKPQQSPVAVGGKS